MYKTTAGWRGLALSTLCGMLCLGGAAFGGEGGGEPEVQGDVSSPSPSSPTEPTGAGKAALAPLPGRVALNDALRRAERELAGGDADGSDTRDAADADGAVGGRASSRGWSLGDWISLLALGIALALMAGLLRWSRGRSWIAAKTTGGGGMLLVDRMAIGRQSTLLVVRLRGRDYLIADAGDGGVRLLKELPPEPPAPEPSAAPAPSTSSTPSTSDSDSANRF